MHGNAVGQLLRRSHPCRHARTKFICPGSTTTRASHIPNPESVIQTRSKMICCLNTRLRSCSPLQYGRLTHDTEVSDQGRATVRQSVTTRAWIALVIRVKGKSTGGGDATAWRGRIAIHSRTGAGGTPRIQRRWKKALRGAGTVHDGVTGADNAHPQASAVGCPMGPFEQCARAQLPKGDGHDKSVHQSERVRPKKMSAAHARVQNMKYKPHSSQCVTRITVGGGGDGNKSGTKVVTNSVRKSGDKRLRKRLTHSSQRSGPRRGL